jgi:LacI family transcriptional regulator
MITTRELAEITGLNQSTISRCLNDSPLVSVKTKELVRKAAKEHGYTIWPAGSRKNSSAKRRVIGILFTDHQFFDDLFINYTVNLLVKKISERNFFPLLLPDITSENSGIQKLRDILRPSVVQGFIILSRYYDEEIHHYLSAMGMPHLYLLHYSRESVDSVDTVDSDNFTGGYLGTKHLLDHGHRFIISLTCHYREFVDRSSGYKKALREYGIEGEDDWIFTGDCTIQNGYSMVKDNQKLIKKAHAIYAQSDLMAIGAMEALGEMGLAIPEDISIIGSDGYELGLMCKPKLDSVAHPIQELTDLAINRLLEIDIAAKPHTPRRQILSPFVIHRESVRKI